MLSTFVKAIKEVLDREPSLQLDIDLPEVSMMQSPHQPKQDLWSFLNDSSIFTPGSSKPARLTRSSLKQLTSKDLPLSPAVDHSVPPGTTESAKSDILVGCNTSRRKKQKMIGNYGSVGKRKRQKSDGVSDEDDSTGLRQSSPLRKKLEFDDTRTTHVLATLESSPKRRIESENDAAAPPDHKNEEKVVVQQKSDITRQFEEVFEVEQKVVEQNVNVTGPSMGDAHSGTISVTCPSGISPGEDGESGRGRRTMEEAKLGERGAVVEREEKVEREKEEGEQGKREERVTEEEGENMDTSSSEEEDLPFLPNVGTEVSGKLHQSHWTLLYNGTF